MDRFVESSAGFSWDSMLHRLWLRGVGWLGNLLSTSHFTSQNLFMASKAYLIGIASGTPRWCGQVIALD
jgi:hypothetical protein